MLTRVLDGTTPLRIAMVVPPFIRVPPGGYGGTELVAGDLAQELARRGHKVTLFATGDSRVPGCETRWLFPQPIWPIDPVAEWNHAVFTFGELEQDTFDVVHCHSPALLPLVQRMKTPVVCTVHLPPEPAMERLFHGCDAARYVCISHRQRELYGATFARAASVVHHGLDEKRYVEGSGDGGYALFLGRLDAVKGPHLAVEAAHEAGLPLRLAGRPHEGTYFADVLTPSLFRGGARLVGELGGAEKIRALGEAAVVLFPSVWEEPFGLVVIEAMLCGTPVVALRRGSMRELIEPGVTGALADEPGDLAAAIRQALLLDRAAIRARAIERFSVGHMVDRYLAVYRDAIRSDRTLVSEDMREELAL
jgi:glycosyltransferase involved in cell wall biosynthesis